MDGNQIPTNFTRRSFIMTAATAAGGFAIGFGALPNFAHAASVTSHPWNDDNPSNPHDIDAWIAIDPDDSILIRYQRAEMGQGSMTALPMMINEELQADWSKVRIEYASANRNVREKKVYGDMFSNGSRSVRASQKKMQQVGASARTRLIAAAATRWGVPAAECTSAASVVTHGPSGRTLRYGEIAADAAKITLNAEPPISRRRINSPSSASRSRASMSFTRSTARRNSVSTRKFPVWSSRRSRPVRLRAAS